MLNFLNRKVFPSKNRLINWGFMKILFMKKGDVLKLILSILVCLGAGFLGSIFTSSSVGGWYLTIKKPPFNPPNWVFAPVWTLLYILMGISVYLILKNKIDKKVKIGLIFFSVQLILNVLWSIIFFGLKNPLIAFLDISLLWIFVLVTILKFWKIDKRASYLLIPYLSWITFAAVLNFSIYILNV